MDKRIYGLTDLLVSVPDELRGKVYAGKPLTAEDCKRLSRIRDASANAKSPLLFGLASIGAVLGQTEGMLSQEHVSNLGFLIQHLAEEAQLLHDLEFSAAEALLLSGKAEASEPAKGGDNATKKPVLSAVSPAAPDADKPAAPAAPKGAPLAVAGGSPASMSPLRSDASAPSAPTVPPKSSSNAGASAPTMPPKLKHGADDMRLDGGPQNE